MFSEDSSMIKKLKSLVMQLKGVVSVKEVKPTKMTEQEFYDMIERSAKTVRKDGANMKLENESMSNYVNRLIS